MENDELTKSEKHDFIELMTNLIKDGILNRDDKKDICCLCLAACDREFAKLREGKVWAC